MSRTIEAIVRHMTPPKPQLSWSKPASLSANGSNGSDKHLESDARITKNILFLQSSPLGSDSYSQRIADSVLNELKAQDRRANFVLRDLSEDSPPHINRAFIPAASTQPEEQTGEQKNLLGLSDTLVGELVDADIIVIAVPVYNFGIPSTLKAWIDHVVRRGRTFSDTTSGPRGLLDNKHAILILAGGDLYSESSGSQQDLREPYLRAVLGFIGITEVEVVRAARPGALGPVELDRADNRTADVSVPEKLSDRKESQMKTKVMLVAVMVMAAMISHAEAGPHAGSGFGGGFRGAMPGGGFARPTMHAVPGPGFSRGPAMYSGQRFSGQRFSAVPIRPHDIGNGRGFRSRADNRSNTGGAARTARTSMAATQRRQAPGENHLRSNWRDHVFARHRADWHHDWDRDREHWWHGHRCRFVDGSWVVFDGAFDPWWPDGWDYSSSYDPGDYSDEYYQQNSSAEQSSNSLVAIVQQELAREGYYRSQIDGIIGPDTQRAINRYQSDHGLRTTGTLTAETLHSLGLDRPASS
jgi:FMN-dependent NADH-azoreductase